MDLTVITTPAIDIAIPVLSAVALLLVNKAIAAFQARTGLAVTDQQRAVLQNVLNDTAGAISMGVKREALKLSEVHISNPKIAAFADTAMAQAPATVAALGVTKAQIIAALVGKADALIDPPSPPTVSGPVPVSVIGAKAS